MGKDKGDGEAMPGKTMRERAREAVGAIWALLDAGTPVNVSRYAAEHGLDRTALALALSQAGISVRDANNRIRDRMAAEAEEYSRAHGVKFHRACVALGWAADYMSLLTHRAGWPRRPGRRGAA